jgi:hypothetical protein
MLKSDFDELGMFNGRNPMDRDTVFTKCRQENRFGDFPEKVRAALRKYRVFSPILKHCSRDRIAYLEWMVLIPFRKEGKRIGFVQPHQIRIFIWVGTNNPACD